MSTRDTHGRIPPEATDWQAGQTPAKSQSKRSDSGQIPDLGEILAQAKAEALDSDSDLVKLRQRTTAFEQAEQAEINNLRDELHLQPVPPVKSEAVRPVIDLKKERLIRATAAAREKRANELKTTLENPELSPTERTKLERLTASHTQKLNQEKGRRAELQARSAEFKPLIEAGIIRGLQNQILHDKKLLSNFTGTPEQRQKLEHSLETVQRKLADLTKPKETDVTYPEITVVEPDMITHESENDTYPEITVVEPDMITHESENEYSISAENLPTLTQTPVPERTAEEIALAKKIDIKADLTELLNVTLDIPELDQVLFDDETLEDLLDRGYRPGDGRLNLQAIVSVLDGKLHIAEEVLDVEFPGVQFENGQPQIGLLGRLFGKKKKILASADYQNFKMLYDFKNKLFAQFETMDTVDESEPNIVEPNTAITRDEPIQIKKRNPLLRYATAATAVAALAGDHNDHAAVSTRTESTEKNYVIPGRDQAEADRRPGGGLDINHAHIQVQANAEPAVQRRDQETEANKRSYAAVERPTSKTPSVKKSRLSYTAEEASAFPRRDLDIADDSAPEESPTPQPRRELEQTMSAESVAEKPRLKPVDVTELIKKFTYSEPSATVKDKTATAFAGSNNFNPFPDQNVTRFNQFTAAPSSGAKAISRFAPEQIPDPGHSKMSLDFTPLEPNEEMDEEEINAAFSGGPAIDFQADSKIFDQGPQKPAPKSRVKPTERKKIKTQFNLDENPQLNALLKKQIDPNIPRLTVSARAEAAVAPAESINPTTRRALSQRFKKVGLSTPDQTALLSHVTKLTQNLAPEAQERKLAKILQMTPKELKKMINSIPR